MRDYRSIHDVRNSRYELEIKKERAKVQERRRRLQEHSSTDNTKTLETEENAREEVNTQPVKRSRGRPKCNTDDGRSDSENKPKDGGGEEEEEEDRPSCSSQTKVDADFGSSQPLRVVLNENSSNHIKIRFVRSTSMDGDQGQTVRVPRRRGRPPKTGDKRKAKSLNTEPYMFSEPPELEMMPLPDEEKENVSDYEDFVQVSRPTPC